MKQTPERLYRISEALPLLGIKSTKFYELLNQGQIRARRVGSRTLIPESEIIRFQNALPDARPVIGG